MKTKIRWSQVEKDIIVDEIRRLYPIRSHLSTVALVTEAQKLLPKDRQRKLTTTQQVEWVDRLRQQIMKEYTAEQAAEEKVIKAPGEYTLIKDRFVEELPPKPDLKQLLVDLLSDAMVQVVAEAIVKARQKLDLPIVDIPVQPETRSNLKKIAIYGLLPSQQNEVRKALEGCYEFRFLKDVPQNKLVTAAQWADKFILMTRFISHNYEAIKKFGNLVYENGAVTSLINTLEAMYVADSQVKQI